MPITAKLSREFYERFGDKVVNEMVDLFNRIDEASRSDLRAFNEQNALRFEARLDQRYAELDAKIDTRYAELDAKIDKRYAELDAKIDTRYAQLDAKIDGMEARLEVKIEKAQHAQTRWMIGLWVVVIGTVLPLWFR